MIKGKKGDASVIITFLIISFFLAVSFLVLAFVTDKYVEVIETTPLNDTTVADDVIRHLNNMSTSTIQNGFVAIFAFLIIAMIISSFLVRIHPVFLIIYIIVLAIAIFAAIPMSNAYQLLINADAIAEVAAQQGMINWIMQNMVMILLGAGVITIIVIFGKLLDPRDVGGI